MRQFPRSFVYTASLFAFAGLSSPALAGTVANWKELNPAVTPVNSGLNTASPTFGDGTADNANSAWIAGLFGTVASPESVTLEIGQTLTASGGMILTGGVNTASNYRFGIFNDNGQFASDGTTWAGGWLNQPGTGLFQGRTDGAFISSVANAVNIGATGTPTGAFSGDSVAPYSWSMSITRDSASTVDLVSTLAGGDGSYSLTYTKDDQLTSLFTYNAIGVLFAGSSALDQGKLVNVQYTVVPEPASLAVIGLAGLLMARRRRA